MKGNRLCGLLLVLVLGLTACQEKSLLLGDDGSVLEAEETGDIGTGAVNGSDSGYREKTEDVMIMVHICGFVAEPGVYEVAEGSRVYEVIELAGGFSPGAAESYLNLAATVEDGEKLVVPSIDEAASDRYGQESAGEAGLININTADKELLMTLPGIGEARALAIIAWRTDHGEFQTKEDIMQVSGIKAAAYEKIKQLITAE